jgi:hypothetical protein
MSSSSRLPAVRWFTVFIQNEGKSARSPAALQHLILDLGNFATCALLWPHGDGYKRAILSEVGSSRKAHGGLFDTCTDLPLKPISSSETIVSSLKALGRQSIQDGPAAVSSSRRSAFERLAKLTMTARNASMSSEDNEMMALLRQ